MYTLQPLYYLPIWNDMINRYRLLNLKFPLSWELLLTLIHDLTTSIPVCFIYIASVIAYNDISSQLTSSGKYGTISIWDCSFAFAISQNQMLMTTEHVHLLDEYISIHNLLAKLCKLSTVVKHCGNFFEIVAKMFDFWHVITDFHIDIHVSYSSTKVITPWSIFV